MDYKKHYDLLIEKANKRTDIDGYCEKHHIVPKCMGGTKSKENIIKLTVREHYVAHWLLHKCYKNNKGLILALKFMIHGRQKEYLIVSSRDYEYIKTKTKILNSGKNHHCYGRTGDKHPMYGKTHTDKIKKQMSKMTTGDKNPMYDKHHTLEARKKISIASSGKKHTQEAKDKISEKLKGRVCSKETLEKMSIAQKGHVFSEEALKKMRCPRPSIQGGGNGRAKQVSIEGIVYSCINDAIEKTGMKRFAISRRLNLDSYPLYKYL